MNMLEIMQGLGYLLVVIENNHFAAVVLVALAAIAAIAWRRPAKK